MHGGVSVLTTILSVDGVIDAPPMKRLVNICEPTSTANYQECDTMLAEAESPPDRPISSAYKYSGLPLSV